MIATQSDKAPVKAGLFDRPKSGPVICAEGYLFELERRGYLQAGAFVPEAVVENPEVVKRLSWLRTCGTGEFRWLGG